MSCSAPSLNSLAVNVPYAAFHSYSTCIRLRNVGVVSGAMTVSVLVTGSPSYATSIVSPMLWYSGVMLMILVNKISCEMRSRSIAISSKSDCVVRTMV